MRFFSFILILAACLCSTSGRAQLSDLSEVSLLTCAPADEVYALYGHTAIRVNDPVNGIDLVFNYGMFDFSASNFIYRFAKGETDYNLGVEKFERFLNEYKNRKSGVIEQVLNLTSDEKQHLFDALMLNAQPENRTYRYNFFYDNCSTRPRILIEQSISGKIEYPEIMKKTTFRTLVHRCNRNHRWLTLGIDLALGAPLDDSIRQDLQLFLPENLMQAFVFAQIRQPDGSARNLILDTREQASFHPVKEEPQDTDPVLICRLLFALTLFVAFFEFKIKKHFAWFDFCLFMFFGILGCVLVFLSFFSLHPAVFPNYSLIWANPLHIIFAIALFIKPLKKFTIYYANICKILLLLLILCWIVFSTQYNQAFLALVLTLCIRAFLYNFPKKTRF